REIQQDKPVMVILGNPPYSGHSANTGKWINDLLRGADSLNEKTTDNYFMVDGEPLGERNPKWLNDDCVKFIRFAQWRIDQTGYGVLAFVTNHGYLDNPTFRGMRQSLMKSFDEIYILDLHGNSKKKERSPDGSKDENVFDIQQGVSIGIFVKKNFTAEAQRRREETKENSASQRLGGSNSSKIFHKHLYGVREIWTENVNNEKELTGGKYQWLANNNVSTTEWKEIEPNKPFYLFTPQDETLREEYQNGWKITEIMPVNGWGIATRKDYLLTDFKKDELTHKIDKILSGTVENAYELGVKDNSSWNFKEIKNRLGNKAGNRIVPYLYRPFDTRSVFYEPLMIERGDHRFTIAQHYLDGKKNLSLLTSRVGTASGSPIWDILFVSSELSDLNLFRRGGAFIFPLYLYPTEYTPLFADDKTGGREPNLSSKFVGELFAKLKSNFKPEMIKDLPPKSKPYLGSLNSLSFSPEDVFNYAYAVFHSPTYRARYAEFLKIDFPRLPLTSNYLLFFQLARFGELLVELHLLEKDIESNVTFPEKGSNEVEFVKFTETPENDGEESKIQNPKSKIGRVWINKTQYFAEIPETVWNFHIGGYQVAHKWLKDRKGRTLNFDDLEHYAKVVSALSQTIELMQKIDELIDENGGFPIE
ncbi:MAG: DNA methyltransferase, partial [Acidobacteriota bacterium]|nr:DNA methyltransferase [Acidobacteriota bacterium]